VRRFGLLLALLGVATVVGVSPAGATNECRGLQVCVRVAGPWVVVPFALGSPRQRVEFQLTCPRGFAVGGLDAELSERAIDVGFVGRLGSPVGPGVTTARSALFGATYVGTAVRTPTFRPHIGCIPAAGGGSGPVPYRRLAAVFPPGDATVRRVRTARLRYGTVRAVAACGAGERLVGAWHAVGFYTSGPPDTDLVRGVFATRQVRGGRVVVTARNGTFLGNVRAIVQVGAVCAGAA
jgi:hypothetical protein